MKQKQNTLITKYRKNVFIETRLTLNASYSPKLSRFSNDTQLSIQVNVISSFIDTIYIDAFLIRVIQFRKKYMP